ncbi:MAG: SDR family NAD(P)-dependent oxidoreductase [Phycisphaerales bacterium]|nr:SDR family NAD(P)-dependent oxidoreductase [Hyphomonadaceae bacterium]
MEKTGRLKAFSSHMRVALFGASGGIGRALLDLLVADPHVSEAYAGARRPAAAAHSKVIPFRFELTDEASVADAALQISADGALDLVIVATGVLHDAALQPEKTWRDISPDAFARAFAVNATGPALIAKHFLPLLARDRHTVFAALSARVGSIEDNRLGGWVSYRASKAALHQVIRSCAIELARKNKTATCVSLHPGTVDTALSAPFQRGLAPERLFTAAFSADRLLSVIDGLSPAESGYAFDWNGARIPF